MQEQSGQQQEQFPSTRPGDLISGTNFFQSHQHGVSEWWSSQEEKNVLHDHCPPLENQRQINCIQCRQCSADLTPYGSWWLYLNCQFCHTGGNSSPLASDAANKLSVSEPDPTSCPPDRCVSPCAEKSGGRSSRTGNGCRMLRVSDALTVDACDPRSGERDLTNGRGLATSAILPNSSKLADAGTATAWPITLLPTCGTTTPVSSMADSTDSSSLSSDNSANLFRVRNSDTS